VTPAGLCGAQVGMAGGGKDANASQFYITTGAALDSLDGKHTLFGEVCIAPVQRPCPVMCSSAATRLRRHHSVQLMPCPPHALAALTTSAAKLRPST
jgi:cyclophilin family peptidyl-prolyl cis-trans isomerase